MYKYAHSVFVRDEMQGERERLVQEAQGFQTQINRDVSGFVVDCYELVAECRLCGEVYSPKNTFTVAGWTHAHRGGPCEACSQAMQSEDDEIFTETEELL